jgi:hypothetical protein
VRVFALALQVGGVGIDGIDGDGARSDHPTVSYFAYLIAHGAWMLVELDVATEPVASQDVDVGLERIGKEFGGGADSLYRRG